MSTRYEVRQADPATKSGYGGSTLSIAIPGVDEWDNVHTDLGCATPYSNYGSTVTIAARSPGGAVATATRVVFVPWDDRPPAFPADALSHDYEGGGMLPMITETELMPWAAGALLYTVDPKGHDRYRVYARDRSGNVGGSEEISVP